MIDPEVSRLKFARALEMLDGDASVFVTSEKWEVVGRTYPLFEVVWTHPRSARRVGFRFLFDDWDARPPSLDLFEPSTGASLPWASWPKNGWNVGDAHPVTHRPFLCLAGIREFHIHPNHLKDAWDPLRVLETYSMLHLMHRVQQRFGDSDG